MFHQSEMPGLLCPEAVSSGGDGPAQRSTPYGWDVMYRQMKLQAVFMDEDDSVSVRVVHYQKRTKSNSVSSFNGVLSVLHLNSFQTNWDFLHLNYQVINVCTEVSWGRQGGSQPSLLHRTRS